MKIYQQRAQTYSVSMLEALIEMLESMKRVGGKQYCELSEEQLEFYKQQLQRKRDEQERSSREINQPMGSPECNDSERDVLHEEDGLGQGNPQG